jgi:hypothetical protein
MKTVRALVAQQGLSTLQRPRFEPGLLLEDDDLTAGVDYTRNLMRLMFRSLFGCGVICGLDIEALPVCNGAQLKITVGGGLALDCMGDAIELPKAQTLTYDPDCKPFPPKIWVAVCYTEKCCRPRDISCSPDDDAHVVHTRAQEGFEIRLYDQPPECACSCGQPPTSKPPPADPCCDQHAEPAAATSGQPGNRDYCACYKDHNEGKCACACGCECVVIGVIDTTMPVGGYKPDHGLPVDRGMVRWIRPVLTGFYLHCPKPTLRGETADEPEAPAGEPGQIG